MGRQPARRMPVIKIKLNQIIKMGYKSTYKSEMIQTRLEQGYYDDIVEAGIQGGVFNADTQPTKEELDLKLAQSASGGLPVIFTIPLQDGDLENTYDYIADVLMNPQDYPDIIPNGIPDFAIGLIKTSMNDFGEKSGDFFIECSKAQFSGTPIREYKIYPVKLGSGANTSSYKVAFVVAGDPTYNSYKVVDFYPCPDKSDKVIYPEIVGYNWSNDGGDSSLTGKDVTIEQVIDKLKDKREEIAGLLEQNEAALVYVKYGSFDLGTEQRPEVYFKVEKTYSRSYLTTGYILRFSVMSPGFENTLAPSIAWVFEDGTYHIWKKEDGVTYPHLGTYNSDNGGEKDLDELKSTFETLTKTLLNRIPENGAGIFDLFVSGMGSLIIKAENVIRQIGTSWERGMYYTIMGGPDGYGHDFENYMGFVWVGVGGGTGGNANAIVWKKNNKMIYPSLNSIPWNDYGNPDIQTLADFLNYNFPIIEGGIDEKGVALLTIPYFNGSRPMLCKVEKSLRWIGTADALGGLYITPLYVDLLDQTPCVIFIGAASSGPVIWKKEEMVETGLPKIELVIPGNIDTENFTTATAVYPYIKEQFESLETLMSGKNAVELKVSFEGSSSYWGFFVYKSTSKHSGVSGMETDVYKIEPYTNSFDNNISYEMKYLYMVKSGDELIARILTYQAGMTDL